MHNPYLPLLHTSVNNGIILIFLRNNDFETSKLFSVINKYLINDKQGKIV